ncbi:helix-turn-helix domain-containing protein [Enterococcus hulanensis]|nr:helix-turn-helix domain-containing protein [Enterococcus hulanensis]
MSLEQLIIKFHPLMLKTSIRDGTFDEACYQECVIAIIKTVNNFGLKN